MENFFNYKNAPEQKNSGYFRKKGSEMLRGFTGMAVLVVFLYTLLSGGISSLFPSEVQYNAELQTEEGMEKLEDMLDSDTDIRVILHYMIPNYIEVVHSLVNYGLVAMGLYFVFSGPLEMGLWSFFLALHDKDAQNLRVGTLFTAFRGGFLKAILINLCKTGLLALAELPSFLVVISSFVFVDFIDQSPVLSVIVLLLDFVLPIVSMVLVIRINYAYRYALTYFADHKEEGVISVLRSSRQMMIGYKMKSFLLDLSYIPLIILAFCCCYIPVFWVLPHLYSAHTEFYCDISQHATPFRFGMGSEW